MIKTVTVTNYLGESLELTLTSPEESGLAIMEITGLGPPKANVNTTEMATMDGTRYNSARMNQRNIVFKFKLLDVPTIEEVREQTYTIFPVKKQVRLDFYTDTRSAYIYGYVESNEPIIFSKAETAQVSVICPDPYFRSMDDSGVADMSLLTPLFEFRYSNESLTDKLTEFGMLREDTHCELVYPGEIETGVTIKIRATGAASGVAFYQEDPDGIQKAKKIEIRDNILQSLLGSTIQAGDEIEICTVKGSKHAWLTRGNISYNILNALGLNVDWFQLEHGTNVFFSEASTGLEYLQVSINYNVLYEGL